MAQAWIPRNREEAHKRHAGRRKMHIRLRRARAERIKALLSDMLGADPTCAEMLRSGAYGATRCVAHGFGVSMATASRDLAMCHLILAEFKQQTGREFNPQIDEVAWSWDFSTFSFKSRLEFLLGKVVLNYDSKRIPFSTRGVSIGQSKTSDFRR